VGEENKKSAVSAPLKDFAILAAISITFSFDEKLDKQQSICSSLCISTFASDI